MFTGWHKSFMHCQKETRSLDIRQLPIIWFWWPGCSDWSCQRLQRADFQIIYNHIKRWYVHQALQASVIGWLVVQNGVFLTKSADHKLPSGPFPLLYTSWIMHETFAEDIKNVTYDKAWFLWRVKAASTLPSNVLGLSASNHV